MSNWEEAKKFGAEHYKTGDVEPVDLYKAVGALEIMALCSVIKYAFRNLSYLMQGNPVCYKDLEKIVDFVNKIDAIRRDKE